MSPKRGDRVAPPPIGDEWDVRYGNNDAAKGWEDVMRQATTGARWAWDKMRNDPSPRISDNRQHRLKGSLATAPYGNRQLPQWQLELTGAARVWYLVDDEAHRVLVVKAQMGHPKETE